MREAKFCTLKISDVVRNYGARPSSNGYFQNKIITLVPKVWPPKIPNINFGCLRYQLSQDNLDLLNCCT